jgi:hypothetical protein
MRVEIEGTRDQHIEARFGRLASGGDKVDTGDGSEFRPKEDRCAPLGLAFGKDTLSADIFARPSL